MPIEIIPITDIASAGVVKDTPPVSLPPNVFTEVRNIRFKDGAIRKMEGEISLYDSELDVNLGDNSLGDLVFLEWWPSPNRTPFGGYYIYVIEELDSTGVVSGHRAYAIDHEGNKKNITPAGGFTESMTWQSTLFAGGFAFILNNGIDRPHYIIDPNDNTTVNGLPVLAELPGWDSYEVNQIVLDAEFTAQNTRIFDLGQSVGFLHNSIIVEEVADDGTVTTYTDTDGNPAGTGTTNDSDFVPGQLPATPDAVNGNKFAIYNDSETNTTVVVLGDGVAVGDRIRVLIRSREPVEVRAGVVRSFNDNLVAGNLTEIDPNSGDIIRRLAGVIRTSDVAAPGAVPNNWNPFAAGVNTADEFVLSETGSVTELLQLQGRLYVYTHNSIHVVEPTGDTSVPFTVSPVTDQYGAIATGSVIEVDGRHIVIGSNDVYFFTGDPRLASWGSIQSVADARVRNYFYENLNPLHEERLFTVLNQAQDEVWICYPTLQSLSGECDEALIWNYRDNTWTIRDLTEVRSGTVSPVVGGGIPSLVANFSESPTFESGDEGQLNDGRKEVQTMTIDGTIRARHTGVAQKQTLDVPAAAEAFTNGVYEASGNEIIHLVITGDASPHTEAASYSISLPSGFSFTYGSEILNGGALITITDNNGTYNIPANALSGLSGSTSRSEYVTAIVNYINGDSIVGFDWSAEDLNGTFRLTSDVVGVRAISGSTLTTYTGTSVSISGSQSSSNDSNNITLVRNTSAVSTPPTTVSLSGNTITVSGASVNTPKVVDFTLRATNSGSTSLSGQGDGQCFFSGFSANSGWTMTGANGLTANVSFNPSGSYSSVVRQVDGSNANDGTYTVDTSWSVLNSVSTSGGSFAEGDNTCSIAFTPTTGHSRVDVRFRGVVTSNITLSSTDGTLTLVTDNGGTNQTLTNYSWTLTNNRSESANPLRSALTNVIVTPGSGSAENLGTIGVGESKTTTQDLTANNNTATYSASVNGTTTQAYDQNTSGVTTTIGSTVFTRSDGTDIAAATYTGTNSGSGGGVTVTVSPNGTFWNEVSTSSVQDDFQSTISISAGDRLRIKSGTFGGGHAAVTWLNGNQNIGQISLGSSIGATAIAPSGTTRARFSLAASNSGGYTLARDVDTPRYNIFFNNTNSYPLVLTSASTGGARTLSANSGNVQVQSGDNANTSWNITHNKVDRYNYAARKTNTASNIVTHANGDITDVPLTSTNQTLVTNTHLSAINVQGSYTVVNATSTPQTNPTVTVNNGGVGVYGISAEDSPAISLRLTHDDTNDDYDFTAEVLFDTDDNTAEEFRDHLFDSWENDTEFMGVDPTNPDAVQPDGAVFYMTKDTYNGDASLRLEHVRGGNISTTVEGFTEFGGIVYDESAFGGVIMGEANVSVEGQGGNTPAVIRLYHPASGEIKTILGGTQTDTEVAQHLATTLQNNAAFSTVTRNGLQLTATRAIAVEGDSDLVEISVDQDVDGLLNDSNWALTGVQTVRAESAEPRGPQMVLNIGTGGTPTNLMGFNRTIYLETDGDTDTTLSATQIANIIKQETFDGWTLDLDTDTDTVTFATELNHSVYRNDNGMGTGDSDESRIWNWDIVSNDGYQPENNEISDTGTAVVTADGINIHYAKATSFVVDWSDGTKTYYAFGGSENGEIDSEYDQNVYVGSGDTERISIAQFSDDLGKAIDATGGRRVTVDSETLEFIATPTQFSSDAFYPTGLTTNAGTRSPATLQAAVQSGSELTLNPMITIEDEFNTLRPWPSNQVKPSQSFPIFAQSFTNSTNDQVNRITAADLGYQFIDSDYVSFIERKQLGLTPEFNVETVHAIALWADGGSRSVLGGDLERATLQVRLKTTNAPGNDVDLMSVSSNSFEVASDYKSDLRQSGRFLNIRVDDADTDGNPANSRDWNISGAQLEISRGGHR